MVWLVLSLSPSDFATPHSSKYIPCIGICASAKGDKVYHNVQERNRLFISCQEPELIAVEKKALLGPSRPWYAIPSPVPA